MGLLLSGEQVDEAIRIDGGRGAVGGGCPAVGGSRGPRLPGGERVPFDADIPFPCRAPPGILPQARRPPRGWPPGRPWPLPRPAGGPGGGRSSRRRSRSGWRCRGFRTNSSPRPPSWAIAHIGATWWSCAGGTGPTSAWRTTPRTTRFHATLLSRDLEPFMRRGREIRAAARVGTGDGYGYARGGGGDPPNHRRWPPYTPGMPAPGTGNPPRGSLGVVETLVINIPYATSRTRGYRWAETGSRGSFVPRPPKAHSCSRPPNG